MSHCKNIGLFLEGALKPDKCLFLVVDSQIGVHKSAGRNIAFLLPSFQFIKQAKRFGAAAGVAHTPEGARRSQPNYRR